MNLINNQIMVIHPYKEGRTWMFDDKSRELVKEPFVAGMDIIIEKIAKIGNIKNAESGFTATFSKNKFPGYRFKLRRLSEEYGGNWYSFYDKSKREPKLSGWLCPALLKYFDKAPKKIYVQVNNNK